MDYQTIALVATFTFVLIVTAAWFVLQYMQASDDQRRQLTEQLVKAAEQMLKGQPGEDKLTYVLTTLQIHYPRMPVQALRHLVEAIVYDLKRTGWLPSQADGDQPQERNARWN